MTDEKIALMEFKIEFDRGNTKEVTVKDNLDRKNGELMLKILQDRMEDIEEATRPQLLCLASKLNKLKSQVSTRNGNTLIRSVIVETIDAMV